MSSKKLNLSGASNNNTLFKYFAKSPASEKKKIPKTPSELVKKELDEKENLDNGSEVKELEQQKLQAKRKLEQELKVEPESDDEDVITKTSANKRRRVAVLSDSEDEDLTEVTKSESKKRSVKDDDYKVSVEESSATDSESPDECAESKPQKKKPKLWADSKISFKEKLQSMPADAVATESIYKTGIKDELILCTTSKLDDPIVWPHQKLDFLKPDKIKDKAGRRPDHPDYDAGTLHVPDKYLNSLSPAVRQWWVLKSDNYDCLLFFKVGKFYELYHMDADVGVKELGFTYMRGEFAHSGFPEVSFDKMASILVDRGYKVARVEQTETPDMMTERCKNIKATKYDKVVRREICQISNRGTQVFGSQCQVTPNHQPNYMLAVVESCKGNTSKYGVCFIDTSIGDFYIGEFDDDKSCSRLLTLLSHNMPVLVLSEKNSLSERTQQIFRSMLSAIILECLPANGTQQCTAEKTLKHLAENYYANTSNDNWPLVLRSMQAENDHLGLTPNDEYKLALKALGQCITYMRKCHLEEKVLPMARYNLYKPTDVAVAVNTSMVSSQAHRLQRSHLVLDSLTLSNLRVTGEEHSLLHTLDKCCTKFGKRLLHHWVCAPSCDLYVIVERQRAITDLLENAAVLQELRVLLKPMPDFERHLAQIHLFGNKIILDSHPDGRAILFEEKLYNKKKIQTFIGILKGFDSLTTIPSMFKLCQSELIKRLTQLPADGGVFPDMIKVLEFFQNAFDHNEAAKTGVVAPEKGVDADYDAIEAKITQINAELQEYLVEQEKYFGCRIHYFGSDKKRYQLEVPESKASKAGREYQLEGQKKGSKPVRRFSTNETKNFLKQMQSAEEQRNMVLKDLSRRIFEKFSNHYTIWKQCIDCVANLDVLASLAEYANSQNVVCVPQVFQPQQNQQPFIEIEEGYHPCMSADAYIPNGISLGTAEIAPLSILTGPNMGGKSTLMRQVGLLTIMTQIGAHVPAHSCRVTLVDRIFTRLGAQDDILAGQSTFLVELNETSMILKHATANSLVLLDELGRGTATYDGTAIAASVVNFLADLKCRTLFSTHYHNIIDFFHKDERITLGHMTCMVENENIEDPTQETVTFLYKYAGGACPKSYGFNAAKLAGMPHSIIKRAYELSKRVEAIALKRKIAAKIIAATGECGAASSETVAVKNLLYQLRACHV